MKNSDYSKDCLKTENTPNFVLLGNGSTTEHDKMVARLLHAVLGLVTEVGEIADQLKKHIIYGKDLDLINIVEEHGDESWYMSLLLDAIGSSWDESWQKNINKLKVRFGDKFSQEAALNRDLDAERGVLDKALKPKQVEDGLRNLSLNISISEKKLDEAFSLENLESIPLPTNRLYHFTIDGVSCYTKKQLMRVSDIKHFAAKNKPFVLCLAKDEDYCEFPLNDSESIEFEDNDSTHFVTRCGTCRGLGECCTRCDNFTGDTCDCEDDEGVWPCHECNK